MTYGKIGPDGGVVPTVDRDNQIMEAAAELGRVDWDPYLNNGLWNDTHDEAVILGVPETLEFHDGSTSLSKDHGKVGFWTTGHLFDRADPKSWTDYTDYVPSESELDRADHFWQLATLLKGLPRPLGFSAHGSMALSPCRSRIIWCQVRQAAVCELPKNPDATAEPLLKGSPLELLRKGMVGRRQCGKCSCPPWACDGLLRKAGKTGDKIQPPINGNAGTFPQTTPDGEIRTASDEHDTDPDTPFTERLVQLIQSRYFVNRATASRWVKQYLHRHLRTRTAA
jgi:hypothetical protein